MLQFLYRKFIRRFKKNTEIHPEEIFIDARNLPQYDTAQFEGRIDRPISQRTILVSAIAFVFIGGIFSFRLFTLEVKQGEAYNIQSEQNRLRHVVLFPERGVISDRNKVLLSWNESSKDHPEFPTRLYIKEPGFAHVLGYVSYPAKDSAGFYYNTDYEPHAGVEQDYNEALSGKKGSALLEVNALGQINSESTVDFPQNGASLTLSIDSRIQKELFQNIESLAKKVGFTGGAGGIIDVTSGELIALVSYPEYDPNVMTGAKDADTIRSYNTSSQKPFLDRMLDGLYTPGSIVKPYVAIAALNEQIIDPLKKILSTGSISVPNPYDKTKKSIFNDWRPQGWIDMRGALAVSSDVYFYEVGGGFEDQKGLGIGNIEKYLKTFGFGAPVPGDFTSEKAGVIPSPLWKAENFDNDPWRIGDTYNTAIGQYGTQATPLQALRGVASIANSGKLLTPTILKGGNDGKVFAENIPIPKEYFTIVQEGMRQGVTSGISGGLNIPAVTVAAKTGTAELGTTKSFVNSWITGFFPYEHPRYAFVVLMEHGPRANTTGAVFVMRGLFDWMSANTPEYFKD